MKNFKNLSDQICLELYDYISNGKSTPTILYEHYMNDMPYGVAKARTGDPDNWLADHIHQICEDFADEINRGRKIRLEKEKREIWNDVYVSLCASDIKYPPTEDQMRVAYFECLEDVKDEYTNEDYAYLMEPESWMSVEEADKAED